MFRRTVCAVGLLAICVLAVIGLVVVPDVLLGAAALGTATAAAAVRLRRRWRRRPRRSRLSEWLSEAVPPHVTASVPAAAFGPTVEIDEGWDVGVTSPAARLRAMSTEGICAAWQRSYWRLVDRSRDSRPLAVVRLRAALLDELERRDPDGFARWLKTKPRPVSNPGPFLAANL